MVNVPRLHCHSAFKHYEMFHCNRESSYGNSIFNTTYNFNGGGFCGGGFMGGLWGGLGMGLGAGLMNLFGGLFGGGMGFGGMGGMNMWNWGGGGVSDGAGGKDKVKTETKIVEKECDDIDKAKQNSLDDKVYNLGKQKTITADEIAKLKKEIEDAKAKSDEHHKTEDNKAYDKLLRRLNDIKPTQQPETNPDPETVSNQKTNTDQNPNPNPIDTNGTSITLQFGTRIKKKDTIDDTIKGKLDGTKTENGKITTYILDSSKIPGQKFGLKYKVSLNPDGTYNVKCINIKKHNCSAHKLLYVNPNGVNYEVIDGKLVNTGNDYVVSTQPHQRYQKLVYTASKLEENDFDIPEDLDEPGKYKETSITDDDLTITEQKEEVEEEVEEEDDEEDDE